MRRAAGVALAALCVAGCGGSSRAPVSGGTIRLNSPAFAPGAAIPARYTCSGADVSPPLRWSHLPAHTAALALTVEDLDAPGGSFTHWALVNLPAGLRELHTHAGLPAGAVAGRNDFGRAGYGGPCPPPAAKRHRYRFVIYALREPLAVSPGFTMSAAGTSLARDSLAVGELIGTYSR